MTQPSAAHPDRPLAIIGQALAFIANPRPIRPGGERLGAQIRPLAVLLVVNVAVLFSLLPLLQMWNQGMGIETPHLVLDKQSPLLVLAVIALLPPLEEIVFRGWLAGRPWQILALIVGVIAAIGAWLAKVNGVHDLALPIGIGALAAIAAGAWALRRRQAPPRWFVWGFRAIFWASALVFAAAHYTNYTNLTVAHAPLVLPQLWAGLLLGYIRLRFGIIRSMGVHMASNALVVAISAATGLAGA